jgi:hypothetical protein
MLPRISQDDPAIFVSECCMTAELLDDLWEEDSEVHETGDGDAK